MKCTIFTKPNARLSLSEFVPQVESCAFVMSANTGDSISSNVIKIALNRTEDVSKIEPIPTRVPFGVAAVVNCDLIFVTGAGGNCNEIWKFDSTSNKWMKCASLVQGRLLHMVAFVRNILFICGGYVTSSRKALNDVESYDERNDRCVSVGKLVYAVRNSGNCVPFKDSLYIFGGCDANHQIVCNVQVYNTVSNSCTLLATLIPCDACLLRAVRWENTVILLGASTCLIYNFDTETWQVKDQFKTGDVHFGLAMNKDKLFVIGGGLRAYALKNAIKWIPVANILNDEPSEWKHHANLPKSSSVYDFVCGEME